MIAARLNDLAAHDTNGTRSEWGVLSFCPRIGKYVLDDYPDHDQAEQARDRIRHYVDASALLVHHDDATGRWAPESRGGAA